MSARVFTFDQFTGLHDQAKASPRLRQHLNIHASHEAPFQRLFIAFGLDSYVRPHRHHLVPKDETLVAVQGTLIQTKESSSTELSYSTIESQATS